MGARTTLAVVMPTLLPTLRVRFYSSTALIRASVLDSI